MLIIQQFPEIFKPDKFSGKTKGIFNQKRLENCLAGRPHEKHQSDENLRCNKQKGQQGRAKMNAFKHESPADKPPPEGGGCRLVLTLRLVHSLELAKQFVTPFDSGIKSLGSGFRASPDCFHLFIDDVADLDEAAKA